MSIETDAEERRPAMPHHRLSYNTSPCLLWWAHSLPPDRSVAVGRTDGTGKGQGGEGPWAGHFIWTLLHRRRRPKRERERENEGRRYRQCRSNQFSIDLRLPLSRCLATASDGRRAVLPKMARSLCPFLDDRRPGCHAAAAANAHAYIIPFQ